MTLSLTAACDRQLVAYEVSSQRTIEWTITVPNETRPAERAPLNLALVLDRSGSMVGDKLRYVQQAACHVLDLLNEHDRVAVVAYDDQINVLSPSVLVTETARNDLKQRINALQQGGWTNLSDGWLEGCREVAEHMRGEHVSRALLLTDGLANRGITDIEELTHHARELRQRGVATSTFGVGLDFNEHLLEALAAQGGGHFYFIERPDQIPAMFRQELGELLTVAAREAFLNIAIPKGVAVELLGNLPHERDSQRLRVFFGDLCAGEQRRLYTRALTPPDMPGTSVVVRGELGYADLDGNTEVVSAEITFSYEREAAVLRVPVNKDVLQRASEIEMAAAASEALRLERAGRRQEAQGLMQHTLAAAAPYMSAAAAANYDELQARMAQGLSEGERKQAHFKAYKLRNTRG
ncbi:MAG TPA: VWA domain-containing protein [Roseiflexaceae bacterium]|nr:VWA domain-containing protein [Roseiflexaceae bacterium]